MNEHGENERLVPFHYSVCRFLFLCVHNKEQTNAESGTHRSQRRINKWNEEQRERERAREPANQNCHILFAWGTIFVRG